MRLHYETLRALQAGNGRALQILSDLEADLNHMDHAAPAIMRPVRRLGDEVLLMAQELNLLTGDRYATLYDVIGRMRAEIRSAFRADAGETFPLTLDLTDERCKTPRIAGGKAAGLATLRNLFPDRIPGAFVASTEAYRQFLLQNDLAEPIRDLLTDLEAFAGTTRFGERTRRIRRLILEAPVPEAIARAIETAAAAFDLTGTLPRWAVRSSATSEDASLTFAGQFDTLLNVEQEALVSAWRRVVASRFTDRAVLYRLHFGIPEVATPMAVLFMPMIEPRYSGVVYSRDPDDETEERVLLTAVEGLADKLVRGEAPGTTLRIPLDAAGKPIMDAVEVDPSDSAPLEPGRPTRETVDRVARMARDTAEALGYEVDMEWAVDSDDALWILQCRPLRTRTPTAGDRRRKQAPPLLENGYTLFPGRAEGPVEIAEPGVPPSLEHRAPVLVTDDATLSLAEALPRIAALLVRHGSPVGHVATLVREYRVPTIYGIGDGVNLLSPGQRVSVDATKRRVYREARWPGIRERVLARVSGSRHRHASGPLHELVLGLNLTDAYAPTFKPGNCRSLHDVVRFIHEMSIRSMFHFGDKHNRFWKRALKSLDWDLPVKVKLLDLDGCTPKDLRRVGPDEVGSRAFQALWRGVQDPRVRWERRRIPDLENLPTDFVEQVLGGSRGPRRPADTNYMVVAEDYLNLNARFVFHYGMIDAIVGQNDESNHVHFRIRGGGADDTRMNRRARFLEQVLRSFHFGVDRKGSLVTAWLRNYPEKESADALEMLGRLMACSRQLDMILSSDAMVERLAQAFITGDYAVFA